MPFPPECFQRSFPTNAKKQKKAKGRCDRFFVIIAVNLLLNAAIIFYKKKIVIFYDDWIF